MDELFTVLLLLFRLLRLFRCICLLWVFSVLLSRFLWRFGLFRFWWHRARTLITHCVLAGRSFTRFSSITRCWITAGSCPCHLSFTARYRASTVRAPRWKAAVNRRASFGVACLFLDSFTVAIFASESRRWIIALPLSRLLSSAARLVARRECGPLAKFSVYRADFQEARFVVLVCAEAIAVLAESTRRWIRAQTIPGLDTFTAILRAVTPNCPFCIATVDCGLKIPVIPSYKKAAQSQGKQKGRQKPSRNTSMDSSFSARDLSKPLHESLIKSCTSVASTSRYFIILYLAECFAHNLTRGIRHKIKFGVRSF